MKKPARKKRLTQICGARNRRGEPCRCKQLGRGSRCKFHGGMSLTNFDRASITLKTGRVFKSPGPKTPAGKVRALANLRPRRVVEKWSGK